MLDQQRFLKRHEATSEEVSQWVPGVGPHLQQGRARVPIKLKGRLETCLDANSFWLIYSDGSDNRFGLRTCFDPQGLASFRVLSRTTSRAVFVIEGASGKYKVTVDYAAEPVATLHVETKFRPDRAMKFVAGPRDLYVLKGDYSPMTTGAVFVEQSGPTSGLVWFTPGRPAVGCLYFQNLTALSAYCDATEADPSGSVAAEWPELGLKLPAGKKPMRKGVEYVVSDFFLSVDEKEVSSETESAHAFLTHLAAVYARIPKPSTHPYDWMEAARRTVRTLAASTDCTRRIQRRTYLNAYVGSTEKPPESMVQLAVLVPLLEYEKWSGRSATLSRHLLAALPSFFAGKVGALARWLPGQPFGDGADSEEEGHDCMDSWYYLHTLMNVARLAALRHGGMMDLLMPSLEQAIKAAHHFDYDWPVFYRPDTLAVIKRETRPGAGGEHDVAGLYAHVMMQAHELTGDERYLKEAEASARRIAGKGFRLLYQTNNTMMTALALIKLSRATGNRLYSELSVLCMANVAARLWVWNAEFGHGKSIDTFMGIAPLQDAPYLAAYEEHEFLATAISYLKEAGTDIHPALKVLLPEYMKFLLHRARFYFCEELPDDAIADKPKEGKIRRELFVPLEDVYAGWKQAGQVGQEVYGSAAALILTTAAYTRIPGLPVILRTEYPVLNVDFVRDPHSGQIAFDVAGDSAYGCRLTVIPTKPGLRLRVVELASGKETPVRATRSGDQPSYALKGGTHYRVAWTNKG